MSELCITYFYFFIFLTQEIDESIGQLKSRSTKAGGPIAVYELSDVEQRGKSAPKKEEPVADPEDEAVLMYTSGMYSCLKR